jgi:antitoxin component of MazEF toxin-antitoxin module
MSEEKKYSFIARVRTSGSQSLIITIPKDIVDLLDLKDKDYVHVSIEKIKKP